MPIPQAGTEPCFGLRFFITTPSLILEKLSQSRLLKQTGLPPASTPAPFAQGAAPACGLPHLPGHGWGPVPVPGWKLLLPPRRNLTVSSICPEGKVVGARVYPSLEWYHNLLPVKKITAITQRITCQRFWSSLRQQTRLGREEGSYRGRGVLFWDGESLLDFLCCQVREQEEG